MLGSRYAASTRSTNAFLEQLCTKKIANASVVALDIAFDGGCGVDHAKLVGATPLFGMGFAGEGDNEEDDDGDTRACEDGAAKHSKKKKRALACACCAQPADN